MKPHDSVQHLQQMMLDGGEKAFDIVPTILRNVIQDKLWAKRCDKNGELFLSFDAFVTAPLWHGLESSIDDLRLYCKKHPEVLQMVEAETEALPAHGGARAEQGNNVTLPKRGNASTYTLKRLKRDRPDLAERVISGVMSANAAAIKAGFRKRTISVPEDIEAAADVLIRHFGEHGLLQLIDAIFQRIKRPTRQ